MIRHVIWDVDREACSAFVGAVQVAHLVELVNGRSFAITEAGPELIEGFCEVYGLDGMLGDRVTALDGYPPAPDAEVLNQLAGIHGLRRDHVLVISAREEAIMAAQAAGMRTCYLWTGKRSEVHPDWSVGNCSELAEMLRGEDLLYDESAPVQPIERPYTLNLRNLLVDVEGRLQPEPVR
jgi:phosphoglycolate phosphatase-like HAD superfamily hydrolase